MRCSSVCPRTGRANDRSPPTLSKYRGFLASNYLGLGLLITVWLGACGNSTTPTASLSTQGKADSVNSLETGDNSSDANATDVPSTADTGSSGEDATGDQATADATIENNEIDVAAEDIPADGQDADLDASQPPVDALDPQDGTDVTSLNDAAIDTTADVVGPADVPAWDAGPADVVVDAGPAALGPLTAPLQTADDVANLVRAHLVVADGVRTVVEKQYSKGNGNCPGFMTKLADTYLDDWINACTVTKDSYIVDVMGSWQLNYTDPCAAAAHHLYTLKTTGATFKGKDNGVNADLAFDVAMNVDASDAGVVYTWQGKAQFKKLPSTWLPDTAGVLAGHVITGVSAQRQGSLSGGTTLSGWVDIDGKAGQFFTDQPIIWAGPACANPASGVLRIQGQSTVVITFAAGSTCAKPTWTRDGLAQGDLSLQWAAWPSHCNN